MKEMKGKCYEITSKNILGHEMIGLNVKVIKSTNIAREGIKGVVVDESQNTFVILGSKGKNEKKFILPKKECEFEFDLENEKVIVKGIDVLKKPEERVKDYKN
jgi:ribonuclease P protein subunit POP4